MRKRDIAMFVVTPVFMSVAVVLNMIEKEPFTFFNPFTLIPKNFEFAQILTGDTSDCLTNPLQTKPITLEQYKEAYAAPTLNEAAKKLPNPFCQTRKGLKYISDKGDELVLTNDLGSTNRSTTQYSTLQRPTDRSTIPLRSNLERPKKTARDR